MLGLLVFFASLGFIWAAWGFWAFVAVLGGKIGLTILGKPRYSYDTNWLAVISATIVNILGIYAVHSMFHEPAYTALAILLVVIAAVAPW